MNKGKGACGGIGHGFGTAWALEEYYMNGIINAWPGTNASSRIIHSSSARCSGNWRLM